MNSAETTTVHRLRTDHRLRQACGFGMALMIISEGEADQVPANVVHALANALAFSLERLCEEHGLNAEGRRA